MWNRSWYVVIIPGLLLFGEVGEKSSKLVRTPHADLGLLVLGYVTSCLGKFDVSDTKITACVNAFFILSVATNVTSTGGCLLATRLPRMC